MARVYLVSLLLCALEPLQGLAQAPSPPPLVPASPEPDPYDPKDEPTAESPYGGYDDEAPPQAELSPPPQSELIPRRRESSKDGRVMFPRIAIESLAGLGLGIAGAIPGSLYILSFAFCDDCDPGPSMFPLALGLTAVGLTSGLALGVKAGGSLMGGEGRFLPTLLGAAAGVGVGGLAAIPLGAAFDGGWLVSLLVFPVTGAVIGYELSHADELKSKAATGTQVSWSPLISVRPSGGVVAGLAGNF
jgi:hypothetical protein